MMEDNEAVIEIIAQGRTPALRHLHRTRRIEVGWLVGVFANEGMLLKYVPTTLQIADMFSNHLTKPSHWEHMLRLAQINDPPESRRAHHRNVSPRTPSGTRSASPSGSRAPTPPSQVSRKSVCSVRLRRRAMNTRQDVSASSDEWRAGVPPHDEQP